MQQIYQQQWISLPKEQRVRLAHVFNISPTGVTEVRDQTLINDGFSNEDLKGITLEKMCEYIGSQETFGRAWEIALAKVHSELNPPIGEIRNVNGEATIVEVVEEIKIVELTGEVIETKIEEIIDIPKEKSSIMFIPEESKPRFCETCSSLGVRHLKYCSKYVPINR